MRTHLSSALPIRPTISLRIALDVPMFTRVKHAPWRPKSSFVATAPPWPAGAPPRSGRSAVAAAGPPMAPSMMGAPVMTGAPVATGPRGGGRAAAIAEWNVEKAVRAKLQVPRVVIGERLDDIAMAAGPCQIETGRWIGAQRVARRAQEAGDHGVPIRLACEVDEETAARRVIRRKRESEKPAFAAGQDDRREVQEVACLKDPVADDANESALLDDELHVRLRRILDYRHGHRQAGDDRGGSKLRHCRRRTEHAR